MMLFIDTNVFLSFYHLTSEDLEELEKLAVLIENKEITLLLPQQVIDETTRNRATKIVDSFETFRKWKFARAFPAYCKNYAQYAKMKGAQKDLEKLHSEMVGAIQADIQERELAADKLLQRLFGIANQINRTPEILAAARERVELGNPPGKKGSFGDAINWECLLATVRSRTPLIMIADDSDFYSPLDASKINEFLDCEWKQKKDSDVTFHRNLSSFFREHYPNINLKTEQEKDALIESLSASPNFASTHSLIAALSTYDVFTLKQAEDIARACLNNTQVRWIIDDSDVHDFVQRIYEDRFLYFDDEFEEIGRLLNPPKGPPEQDDEIPF